MGLYALAGADLRNLKNLKIDVIGTLEAEEAGSNHLEIRAKHVLVKAFIQAIRNAPNLVDLNLKSFILNLNDMEWIHPNAPKLEWLWLEDTALNIISDTDIALSRDST